MKEREQKSKFSKEELKLLQQTLEIKQLRQIVTLKYNYSSSQTAEFHPLLRVSRDHSTIQPQTVATVSFTCPPGTFFC